MSVTEERRGLKRGNSLENSSKKLVLCCASREAYCVGGWRWRYSGEDTHGWRRREGRILGLSSVGLKKDFTDAEISISRLDMF